MRETGVGSGDTRPGAPAASNSEGGAVSDSGTV